MQRGFATAYRNLHCHPVSAPRICLIQHLVLVERVNELEEELKQYQYRFFGTRQFHKRGQLQRFIKALGDFLAFPSRIP